MSSMRRWAVDIARAYNSWLHASYTKRTSRILGAALIPIHDVPAAVKARVAEVSQGITSGKIKVPETFDGPEFPTPAA